jgi:hypothetical protein
VTDADAPQSRPRGTLGALMSGQALGDPVPVQSYHARGLAVGGGAGPAVIRPGGSVPGGHPGQAAPVRRGPVGPEGRPGGRSNWAGGKQWGVEQELKETDSG